MVLKYMHCIMHIYMHVYAHTLVIYIYMNARKSYLHFVHCADFILCVQILSDRRSV